METMLIGWVFRFGWLWPLRLVVRLRRIGLLPANEVELLRAKAYLMGWRRTPT